MSLFPGCLSCSIDLFVCFCVSTTPFWLLWLCSPRSVWNQSVVWNSLKSGSLIPPALFFLQVVWGIWGPLCFHTNFLNLFIYFSIQILKLFVLTLERLVFWQGMHQIYRFSWVTMIIFTTLVLPTQGHGASFRVCVVRSSSHQSYRFLSAGVLPQCSALSQSCLTLHDPSDGSPPGSSVRGIFQARILEWVAISSSITSFT